MNEMKRLARYVTASTVDDRSVLTRILKTHTDAGILRSYSITSIKAVKTKKQCMNQRCNNTADFVITQVFPSGKHFSFYLCKYCIKNAFISYTKEILSQIDKASEAINNDKL